MGESLHWKSILFYRFRALLNSRKASPVEITKRVTAAFVIDWKLRLLVIGPFSLTSANRVIHRTEKINNMSMSRAPTFIRAGTVVIKVSYIIFKLLNLPKTLNTFIILKDLRIVVDYAI
jgi:hypothetical protein